MKPKILVEETGWRVPRIRERGTNYMIQIPHKAGRTMHIFNMMAGCPIRNGKAAKFVKTAFGKGRQTIVFADTLAHLDTLHNVFLKAGIPQSAMVYYVGGMTKAAREAAKKKPVLLCTYKMTSKGTDIPTLDAAVMMTPRADVEQIIGRLLRELEGKSQPVVLDLVDSDSPIFYGYHRARMKFYIRSGYEVVKIRASAIANTEQSAKVAATIGG